jgi:hypothetical protein
MRRITKQNSRAFLKHKALVEDLFMAVLVFPMTPGVCITPLAEVAFKLRLDTPRSPASQAASVHRLEPSRSKKQLADTNHTKYQ